MPASTAIAKPDVVRRREAGRSGSVDARRAPVVDQARPAAEVVDAPVAVRDHRVLGGARLERVDGFTDEGELGVGGLEPVEHLFLREEAGVGFGLVNAMSDWLTDRRRRSVQLQLP